MPTNTPFFIPGTSSGGGGGATINLTAQGLLSVSSFSSLPSASSSPNVIARVADVGAGGSLWYSDGTNWKPASSAIPLLALSYGGSGLSIGPSTSEFWVGPEIMIPAGVVKPGNILTIRAHWQESGVSDSGARTLRFRVSTTPGVIFSSQSLPNLAITNSSSTVIEFFKGIFVSSGTNLHTHWAGVPGGHGGSSNVTLPGSGFDADLYMRPSFSNQSTTGAVTLYHISVWLYSSAL